MSAVIVVCYACTFAGIGKTCVQNPTIVCSRTQSDISATSLAVDLINAGMDAFVDATGTVVITGVAGFDDDIVNHNGFEAGTNPFDS